MSKLLLRITRRNRIIDEKVNNARGGEEFRSPRREKIILHHLLTEHAVAIGLGVRFILGWFLPQLLDGGRYVPGVEYTDIDYRVFSDAVEHLHNGRSPYERHTYRYTPFLAAILARVPYSRTTGRFVFCLADAACGWMILRFRRRIVRRNRSSSASTMTWMDRTISPRLQDALWWLYNPLSINICTRGSAESFVVLLPVLITVWLVVSARPKTSVRTALLAGFCHGIAVHAKLYPIIYSLSFMVAFTKTVPPQQQEQKQHQNASNALLWRSFVVSWARRLLTPAPMAFFISFFSTFCASTYLAVLWYGPIALQEGLLYHFSRVDHRHNYSMHWYWIYLARAAAASTARTMTGGGAAAGGASGMAILGRVLLLPQLALLVYTSLTLVPYNLCLALFVQTFLFVAHNKVITAQYFTWYLCLLPLCSDSLAFTPRVARSLLCLLGSVVFWLASAYCLEMQGMAVHRLVWLASVVFFVANVQLLGALLESSRVKMQAMVAVAQPKNKDD